MKFIRVRKSKGNLLVNLEAISHVQRIPPNPASVRTFTEVLIHFIGSSEVNPIVLQEEDAEFFWLVALAQIPPDEPG